MSKLPVVSSAQAFSFSLGGSERVLVIAKGMAPTSGWSNPRLSPYFYITPPEDGFWGFDLVADEPSGIVLQVQLPLTTSAVFSPPDWMKGIRIHAEGNSIDVTIDASAKTAPAIPKTFSALNRAHVIVRQEITSYDDSHQPIGHCGGFSIKMKKLHHTLTLVVEGPDENRIRQCINESAGIGLIAAIIAGYVTGGAALQAAISAFLGNLKGCLGDSFSVRIDDESHWIEWCT